MAMTISAALTSTTAATLTSPSPTSLQILMSSAAADEAPAAPLPPRSQLEVQSFFGPLLREENSVHVKAQTSYIRPAIKGEKIQTILNGVLETKNTVQDDTSYIVCGKAAGEFYVLTQKNFSDSYDASSKRPIPDDDNNKIAADLNVTDLRNQGFFEYSSKRSVLAHQVNAADMAWLQQTTNTAGQEAAYFVAPWGELMRVEIGDLLVTQYPAGSNDEVYRIEKNAFASSYKPKKETTKS